MPVVHPTVDKCIECGFCEVNCLTGKDPQLGQRIIVQREVRRLRETGENPGLLKQLDKDYFYPGRATCAGDGSVPPPAPWRSIPGTLPITREQAYPRNVG